MIVDGPPRMVAWQPGQVGNEAAKPKYCQCRGFGSSTSPLVLPPLLAALFLASNSPKLPVEGDQIAIAYIY